MVIVVIATYVKFGALTLELEVVIVSVMFEDNLKVVVLVKYYVESMLWRFIEYVFCVFGVFLFKGGIEDDFSVDLVVVGGGLAGLTVLFIVFDCGGRVMLVEKEVYVGGNF